VNEGYGLTCVEAMACGCALVVTDFAGSKEYAVNGANSLVVPVGDIGAISRGVVEVLSDRELRAILSAGGLKTAQNLDWEVAVEKFARLLGIAR
ncbi:glycosyltransferase, partial [Paratractidigestivibacter sp.]|uniref:glycosyltransferase n=1 Tax=Paratractidigestivibacter sp. TaxID=2847316 RepID=UPI002ACB18F5